MTFLTSQASHWAKQLGLGIALYQLYHVPRQFLQQVHVIGPGTMINLAQSKRQMAAAAAKLPPLPSRSGEPLDICYLSGRQFWYQTVFCFYSLALQTDLNLQLVVIDDGTLSPRYRQLIRRSCPTARFVLNDDIQSRLDTVLPKDRYPTLRSRREEYPNLRKLTDIHAGTHGWKLVLDSDMLFFHPPAILLNWLKNPQQPCYMVDVKTAYGYPPDLMEALAGVPVPERINVGITGLNSDDLDWDKLEYWCHTQIEQSGSHYYQEQSLFALFMASHDCCVMPADNYVVMPSRAEVMVPTAQLHHYVADSKTDYFRLGWKHIEKLSQLPHR